MISETQGMLGGETYIKAGDGEVSKVRRTLHQGVPHPSLIPVLKSVTFAIH